MKISWYRFVEWLIFTTFFFGEDLVLRCFSVLNLRVGTPEVIEDYLRRKGQGELGPLTFLGIFVDYGDSGTPQIGVFFGIYIYMYIYIYIYTYVYMYIHNIYIYIYPV